MTSITNPVSIGMFRAANESQLSQVSVPQAEVWAEGADLEGTPLDFATPTDPGCSIEPATVREGLRAYQRLSSE
jgi:hypothetical protein